jgi:hypothetical protein
MKDPRLRYLLPLGLWLADTWDNGAGPDDQATRHQLVPLQPRGHDARHCLSIVRLSWGRIVSLYLRETCAKRTA